MTVPVAADGPWAHRRSGRQTSRLKPYIMRSTTSPGAVNSSAADEFTAPGDVVERMMYGFSLLVCLPERRCAHGPSAATGTVMRRRTLTAYARAAGFSDTEVLPIEGFSFLRFYRLR